MTPPMPILPVFMRSSRLRLLTKNLEIVTAEAFTADNKSDLSTQVAKCQEAGADLVFLPIYYQELPRS